MLYFLSGEKVRKSRREPFEWFPDLPTTKGESKQAITKNRLFFASPFGKPNSLFVL